MKYLQIDYDITSLRECLEMGDAEYGLIRNFVGSEEPMRIGRVLEDMAKYRKEEKKK